MGRICRRENQVLAFRLGVLLTGCYCDPSCLCHVLCNCRLYIGSPYIQYGVRYVVRVCVMIVSSVCA